MVNYRDDILDFLKGILICLVVYAHLPMDGRWHNGLHSLAGFIYSFHIYAFVLVTGFLFSRKLNDGGKGICKVAKRMFKPYFIIAPLNAFFYYVAWRLGLRTTNFEMRDGGRIVIDILLGNGGGALWYLYTFGTLQILILFCNMLPCLAKREKIIMSSVFSCVIAYFLKSVGVALNVICLSFFYIGIYLGMLYDKLPRRLLYLFVACLVYLMLVDGSRSSLLHIVWVMCIVFGMLGLGENLKNTPIVKGFSFIGKHTLTILIFHPFITTASRLFASKILLFESTGVLLSLVILSVDVSCCILIEFIMSRLRLNKLLF